jgi:hypothetical protein
MMILRVQSLYEVSKKLGQRRVSQQLAAWNNLDATALHSAALTGDVAEVEKALAEDPSVINLSTLEGQWVRRASLAACGGGRVRVAPGPQSPHRRHA